MDSIENKIKIALSEVLRPGRYAGNELNVIHKDWLKTPVRIALAFPDVYEIGMSHTGMQILYHVLNENSWIAAERVYSPWIDMEAQMRALDIPLFTLESKRPVAQFDLLGITLQYELQYTNVLNLLDLAGIPLYAKDREEKMPFVIGGGPVAFNPEPMSPFFDAFVLGDGEEAAVEAAECIRTAKLDKRPRHETLNALAQIDGVYVPALYKIQEKNGVFQGLQPVSETIPAAVSARILERLDVNAYPLKPLVPQIEITHDRFSLEIMRGCTRGCRFCQAGMIYRPLRVRPVDEMVEQTRAVLNETGYDEISLVSLSSSDYPCLKELMEELQTLVSGKHISVSLPSMRPETFTQELARFAAGYRKSGLTLAPEAGSQRLRDVINKNNTEADLLNAARVAFENGWKRIKLYFMIGLPTETLDDVEAIADLVGRVVRLGKEFGRVDIGVSISPFSPKAHTPFQWEGQDTLEAFREKIKLLTQKIKWKSVKLNWRDPRVSRLEAALGLGDRSVSEVIYAAWQGGQRFDSWTDQFNASAWDNAFEKAGISMDAILASRKPESSLPWDHIEKGISKEFLIEERAKAREAAVTPDCRTEGCQNCGVNQRVNCYKTHSKQKSEPGTNQKRMQPRIRKMPVNERQIKLRIAFRKGEALQYTSHLDMIRIFSRAFRRANIPIAMSKGYHARMKIATGPPLSLGFIGRMEYIDVDVDGPIQRDFDLVMNRHLPAGVEVVESKMIVGKSDSLNSIINLAEYEIMVDETFDSAAWQESADVFIKSNSHKILRNNKERDIRIFVEDIEVLKNQIKMTLKIGPSGTARVDEVMEAIRPHYEEPPRLLCVERTGLFIVRKNVKLTPLEVI